MTAAGWLIVLPLAAAPAVYLAGRVAERTGRARPLARWLAVAVLLAGWLPFSQALARVSGNGPTTLEVGQATLRVDGLSLLVAALALTLGLLVALFSGCDVGDERGSEKYFALLLALTGTTIGLASAADLFNLWVWFEAMAICSYTLVAFRREDPLALEAAVKYLVQSAIGSTLALVGIALVLAQAGTLNLEAIRVTVRPMPSLLAAGALLVVGFGVKTAFVPLHTWLPDAYQEAPSGVSALLAGVVTKLGLVALLRVLAALAGVSLSWGVLLVAFGALNMLVGNLLALRQRQVKRLLAYSSLSHLGYIFFGVGVGFWAGEAAGVEGGMFHLLTHGLMVALAFLAAGALIYAVRADRPGPLTVADLAGAAQRYPLVALALSVAVLGLGGLPPLAGFMSKWQILVAGVQTHDGWMTALVVFAALNSVLSLAYYAPIVNAAYRLQPSAAVRFGGPVPASMRLPLLVLGLAVVAIGVWPGLVHGLTAPAGAALLAAFGAGGI